MVALVAKARVIDDTARFDHGEANLASKGLIGGVEHLSEEITHGGRGSIVKRAPIVPYPIPLGIVTKMKKLGFLKKLGPLGIPLKLLFAACIAGTGGACAGAGK